MRKLLLIYIIFTLLGCKKTAVKPSETTTPEYSETQESTVTDFRDNFEDPQKDNKMLVDYLEKENKSTSELYIIPRAGNFTDFTPILEFKNLETLWINNYMTDISGITVLLQHKKLSELILWTKNVTDISPLSALVNLRLLNVNVVNTCTDASELLPLVNLETLVFIPTSSETIRNISKLKWLKCLYLGLNYEGLDISPVQNLKNLENLTIRGPFEKNTEFDFSWISQLVNLQEIKFEDLVIKDVSPLLKLPNLKFIDVMWSKISDENIALLKKTGAGVYTHADADH